jgi:uncharacterized surface protein with fasciclin (FAS1) repeats
MKNSFHLFTVAIIAFGMFYGMVGCSKPQQRYEDPPWLGGSSIETLEGRGNYKIFLQLMDSANYRESITKQLFTLFVPNDEAFTAYFLDAGISSVEDLSKDEAIQLFTLHVLRNPRSQFQLIYEYLWDELQGPDGEYASLFFRKPTTSTSLRWEETVRYWPAKLGEKLTMDTGDKLIPLFSTAYFLNFNGASDGSDYLYMYPGSNWGNNLQWHNSMVTEAEVRTASGFLYFIDKVVPPTPSIEEYLIKHQDKYGIYYDLMQRFATYSTSPRRYADKQVTYRKSYTMVSNLAEEQGAFTGNEVRMKDMFTLFLPSDSILGPYLKNGVLQTYPSLDSVPEITLYYILQTQISRALGLISKISVNYFNSFGDAMTVSKDDIKSSYMCSNGVVYDMKRVLEPNVFSCVPGYLFFNANYSTFLNALTSSNLLAGVANPDLKVTLFAPTNAELETYNIRFNSINAKIETRGKDKVWKTIKTEDLNMIVQDHIYVGVLTDLSGDGFIEMNSGNFIHYSNNEITGPENQSLGDVALLTDTIMNRRNGILNIISNPIKSKYLMGQFIKTDPEVSAFRDSLISTGLLVDKIDKTTSDTIPTLTFLTEARYWTGFVPTNDAMAQASADGLIPPKDKETNDAELKKFLFYHFVRGKAIFDDGIQPEPPVFSNRVDTITTLEGTLYSTLLITNSLNNLSVQDHSGQVVPVLHPNANILVRKGVAHKINSVFKY